MARALSRIADSNKAAILAALVLLGLGVAHWWPTSWWMEVRRIAVLPGRAGEPVVLMVDRIIHRPFHAQWHLRVWRHDMAAEEVACEASGGGDYRPTARLPPTVTLRWYSAGECDVLPAGRYSMTVTWRIARGVLPPAIVSAESNAWLVQ